MSERICCLASLRSSRKRCQSSFCFCPRSGALCVISVFSTGVAMSDSGCASGAVTRAEPVKNAMSLFVLFIALTLKRLEKIGRRFSPPPDSKELFLIQPVQRSFLLLQILFQLSGLHVLPFGLPIRPYGLRVQLSKLLRVRRAELRVLRVLLPFQLS